MENQREFLKELLKNPGTSAFSRLKYIPRNLPGDQMAQFINGLFLAATEAKDQENWDLLRDYLERWEDVAVAEMASRLTAPTNGVIPWAPLKVSLPQATIALVTTGGLYVEGQPPYEEGEWRFREIPRDTPHDQFRFRHWGYDLSGPQQDVNCVFPIDRFKELEAEGRIGRLADTSYGFMGLIRKTEMLVEESAPECARRLKAQGVDAVFLAST